MRLAVTQVGTDISSTIGTLGIGAERDDGWSQRSAGGCAQQLEQQKMEHTLDSERDDGMSQKLVQQLGRIMDPEHIDDLVQQQLAC